MLSWYKLESNFKVLESNGGWILNCVREVGTNILFHWLSSNQVKSNFYQILTMIPVGL